MAGISTPAKGYLKTAWVRAGIPHELIDEALAKAPAGTNLSLGASSHDVATGAIIDALRVSVGFPAQGTVVTAADLERARLTAANDAALYPPVAAQTSTNYMKNV